MDAQIVVFNLGNESYGVDIHRVDSIIKKQTITSIPKSPEFVEGVTNLRGELLPVVDLRCRLGLPVCATTNDTRIMVIALGAKKVGMVVDSVSEVLNINQENIEPPSPLITTVDSVFIEGIAKESGHLIILIALSKVLSNQEKEEINKLTV